MQRPHSKNSKSLTERLRDHLRAPSRANAQDQDQREKIRRIADEVDQNQFSTIARVMAGGPSRTGAESRGSRAVHRILEEVEDRPGCNVHDLAEKLGEKSIFVLSHADELVREGLLVRLDNGALYRSRDYYASQGESPRETEVTPDDGRRAWERIERSRIFLRVFRFLTRELGMEPMCGAKMVVLLHSGKFFEMKGSGGRVNMSLYGVYPGDLMDRFKQEAKLERRQINYSRLTGILDIRGCEYKDLEVLLPWIAQFYEAYLDTLRQIG